MSGLPFARLLGIQNFHNEFNGAEGLNVRRSEPLQSDREAFSITQLSLPIEERHINGGNTTELVICVISHPSQQFVGLVTGLTQASTGQPLQQGYDRLVPEMTIIAIAPLHGVDI